MSKLLGFFIASFLILVIFAGGLLSYRGQAVNYEETIKAQYEQNQNNYDNMWKKFKELAQVTDRYATDLEELYEEIMIGRYGADGSQALFQWITENNPTLAPEMYTNLQSTLEAGRNSFEADQKQLIAKKEQYNKFLRSNKSLVYNSILNFPKIDMDKYDIVLSVETNGVFESKEAEEIKLFE